jgi:hypothetical protein
MSDNAAVEAARKIAEGLMHAGVIDQASVSGVVQVIAAHTEAALKEKEEELAVVKSEYAEMLAHFRARLAAAAKEIERLRHV